MASNIRIIVPAIDWTRPAGGVRKLYRHVDVLNAHGVEALIMHQQPGFRCTWFDNNTRVASFDEVWPPRPGDVILTPEILAWQFVNLAPGTPKIIFNQNPYQTFAWRTEQYIVNPYLEPDFRAVIVVSEDSRAYIRHAFPTQNVFRIRYSVDPRVFYFSPAKKRQIAYMPRKKEKAATQVLSILKYRGLLNDYEVVKIEEKTEAQTAQILRESAIFLSFSTQEGWGLPPMEAMACGCVTIGYDGRGGTEYFIEPYATPIPSEDIPSFAAATEQAILALNANPQAMLERTRRASKFIHETYSPETEAKDILTTWHQLVDLINAKRS